jgi:KDO2-lipid IV(A) lauroyltransferase
MIYWLHRFGAPLSRWLPVGVSYGLASLIAPLVFSFWREKRLNTIENMRAVLGEDADPRLVRRISLRAFTNYAKYMVDMLRLPGLPMAEIERRVTIEGWENLTTALDDDTGLIFVGGHIGNSDLAAALLAGRGFPVHVIAESLQPPKWDELVQAARSAVGLRVIPMGAHAMRFLRVLREKEILAFLIDRPVEEAGVPVTFFGRETNVPAGAAALALRANAQILGAYIVRSGNSYVARISRPFAAPSTGDPARDLEALTQALFDWMERVIRQYPDQWFMFRRMWPSER